MAIVVKDRVQETSATTGTGTLTLDGAVSGFQTFSSAIGNGNYTYYSIVNGAEWEVGYGAVTAGQLSRDNVWESSNSGALVNFSAGTKSVFCTYPAEKAVIQDQNGKVGIGTNTPSYQLEVYGSEPTSRIYIDNTGYAGMLQIANPSNSMLVGKDRDGSTGWYGNAGQYIIACNGAFPLDFYTNGTKRMSLTSAGGVSFGTSATAYGTSGQVLTSNGNAAPTWANAAASGFSNIEIFASSTTWTVPSGITKARVTVIGGGGGGGSSSATAGGGVGGIGGIAVAQLTGLSGSVTVTVGAGGTGNNTGSAGTAGGTSSFGSYLSATGGAGGALNGAYANAASGAGTVSIGTGLRVIASSTLNGTQSFPSIINGQGRQPATSSTSPIAYSSTGLYCAGNGGNPEEGSAANNATGGIGGVVIVEY